MAWAAQAAAKQLWVQGAVLATAGGLLLGTKWVPAEQNSVYHGMPGPHLTPPGARDVSDPLAEGEGRSPKTRTIQSSPEECTAPKWTEGRGKNRLSEGAFV